MSIVLVITGLVAALVPSTYKWGYYTFGVSALFYIWYVPYRTARVFSKLTHS